MQKTQDYVHYFSTGSRFSPDGLGGLEGRFRIQLYEEPGELPVIICSKYADHFIGANFCESLTAEILLTVLPKSAVRARKGQKYFHFVDHIPDVMPTWERRTEWFDLLEYDDYRIRSGPKRGRVRNAQRALEDAGRAYYQPTVSGTPHWSRVNRETVEEMIGAELEDYSHLLVAGEARRARKHAQQMPHEADIEGQVGRILATEPTQRPEERRYDYNQRLSEWSQDVSQQVSDPALAAEIIGRSDAPAFGGAR